MPCSSISTRSRPRLRLRSSRHWTSFYRKYVPLSVQEYLRLCQTRDEAESVE